MKTSAHRAIDYLYKQIGQSQTHIEYLSLMWACRLIAEANQMGGTYRLLYR